MPLKIPAIKFSQKGTIMYLATLPIDELDFCSIDHWDPQRTGKWKGYQRSLNSKKIDNLSKYLERHDAILPVAGLLNVRKNKSLLFHSSDKKKKLLPVQGILTINDETRLWVVDMQHRLEGIKLAHSKGLLKDFDTPVLITEGLSDVKEAAQFYIINTKARRMGVDLTRRLLIEHGEIQDIADIAPWELKAVQIAIKLNHSIKNNPWYHRIREPESEKKRDHIATEKSFVPSLRWLLVSPKSKSVSVQALSNFLANLWEGLRINMPKAFDAPRAYLIQKTPGYMAFHKLAPILYRKYPRASAKFFARFFKPFSEDLYLNEKFWMSSNRNGAKKFGTGQSAYSNLAIELSKKLRLK